MWNIIPCEEYWIPSIKKHLAASVCNCHTCQHPIRSRIIPSPRHQCSSCLHGLLSESLGLSTSMAEQPGPWGPWGTLWRVKASPGGRTPPKIAGWMGYKKEIPNWYPIQIRMMTGASPSLGWVSHGFSHGFSQIHGFLVGNSAPETHWVFTISLIGVSGPKVSIIEFYETSIYGWDFEMVYHDMVSLGMMIITYPSL